MFRPAPALDLFGDDERRRCTPEEADEDLFGLHLRAAIAYGAAHAAMQAMPYCTELAALMEERGHPLSLLEGDQSTDTPWGIAKAYVDEVTAFLTAHDGWNADGSMGGREFSKKERWQPLFESDGLGYITAQEHVTPHIGMTSRFFGFQTAEEEASFASRKADKPSYRKRYKSASRDVLEESRLSATDPLRQFAISFFDNKVLSLIPLKAAYFLDRQDALDAMEFYDITIKVQLALYNSVMLVGK
eukprot:g8169.t1